MLYLFVFNSILLLLLITFLSPVSADFSQSRNRALINGFRGNFRGGGGGRLTGGRERESVVVAVVGRSAGITPPPDKYQISIPANQPPLTASQRAELLDVSEKTTWKRLFVD